MKNITILKPLILVVFSFLIATSSFSQTIGVNGLGINIPNGDTTPSLTDSTDFGTVNVLASVSDTFRILNTNATNLDIFGSAITGTHASMFVITTAAGSPVVNNDSTDLVVTFTPTSSGLKTATVNIFSNDAASNPYTFDIQGTGLNNEMDVQGLFVSITNGDVTPDVIDGTDFGNAPLLSNIIDTFKIHNTSLGPDLTIGAINITGTNSSEFIVSTVPVSPVGNVDSTLFAITFTPTGTGIRVATVSIVNNDEDENPYTFSIQGNGTGPEMDVQGLFISIVDGDNTPSTTDDTDFGNSVVGSPIVTTFTVHNTAATNLTVSNPTISGANAADFSVTANPTSPVTTGDSTTFNITFTPSATGIHYAEISIVNNDDNENPYNFTIEGNGITAREIDIQGNGVSIVDGDTSPDGSDDTDFGSVAEVGANTNVNIFTIYNIGEEDLDVTSIVVSGAHSGDFTLSGFSPTVTVNGLTSTTFTITFNPSAVGLRTATITVNNTDGDEGVYNFDIQGNGTSSSNVKISDLPNSTVLCSGTITDSDAKGDGDYEDDEDFTYTISSTNADRIGIKFISDALFQIETGGTCGGTSCTCDYLEVNYGPTTGIVRYCDASMPTFGTFIYGDPGADIILHFVSDGNQDRDGFTIDWEARINANVVSTDFSCNGANDGLITITPTPGTAGHGTANYQYQLDGAGFGLATGATKVFNGLSNGIHTLNISDLNGCLFDTTITITQPAVLNIAESHTDENCAGSADGTLNLSATGGTIGAGYDYYFDGSPFTTTTNYNSISNGNLLIQVQDSNNCIDSARVLFNVGSGGAPTGTALIGGNDFFCLADATDHAFNVTGVTGAGSYSWTFYPINPTTLPTINTGQNSATILVDMSAVTDSIYLEVDASNACGNLEKDTLIVYPSLVSGSFIMAPTTISSTITSVTLAGLGTPAGGVFSGGSVIPATPEFDPSAAGVGNHIITYTYTDANSCVFVYNDDINVITNAGGITGLPANENYCHDLDYTTQILTASESFSEKAINVTLPTNDPSFRDNTELGFDIDGNSTGIVFWNNNLDCRIDPSQLSHGSHSLNFKYARFGLTPTTFFDFFGCFCLETTYNYPWRLINIETVTQDFFVDSIGGVNIIGSAFACNDQLAPITYSAQYQHTPGSGTWSAQETPFPALHTAGLLAGSNTFSAQFDPVAAGSTNSPYRILYDYESTANGGLSTCTAKDTLLLTVAAIPTPSFTLAPFYSEQGTRVSTFPSPTGGSYTAIGLSNIGIVGSNFYPNLADTGTIGIIYTYGDPSTSCISADTNYTYVIPNKGVINNLNATYCIEDASVTITGFPNANQGAVIGTFSIDILTAAAAIIDNGDNTATFDPVSAGEGEHTVTFSWLDQSILFSISQIIFVDSIGTIDIISLDSTCVSDTNLVDFIANYSHASGIGFWSSSATSFDTISSIYATINPSLAGFSGSPYQVMYEYESSDHGSGCKAYDTANFIVHPLPVLNFDLNPYYSEQDTASSTNPIPNGIINGDGNFTGAGMVQDEFAPQIAESGGHIITYLYTDPVTGCSNSIWDSTFVIANTGNIVSLTPTYCIDGVADTIYGNPNGGGVAGDATGTFSISASSNDPNAIVNIGNGDTAIFYPALAGPGNHLIVYDYTDKVDFKVSKTILVDSIGPVYMSGLNTLHSYCEGEPVINLADEFNHPSGSGVFTYNGLSSFTNANSLAFLTPDSVETAQITYTYTSTLNGSGCTADSTETITIHSLPVLSFDLLSNYCTNDSSVLVVGAPLGGSFDGNGSLASLENYSTTDSIDFIPENTAGGVSHTLTYTFTDGFNCYNSVDSTFTLHVAPNVLIDSDTLRIGYCELTDPSYPVTGLINGVNINDGYFWGAGITDIDSTDGHAEFITDNVTVGTNYAVYYTYTDANNCYDVDSAFVDVYQLPLVTLSGLTASKQYCNNHDIIFNAQQFIGAPPISAGLSGTFILDTVTTSADQSIFDPTIYVSNFQETIPVSYTYTDNNGCINEAIDTVYVNPAAHPSFSISGLCIVDSITYTDQTTNPPAPDGLLNWEWTINDSIYTTQNATHKFPEGGNHTANIEITTVAGCTSDTTVIIGFGDKPTADFYWINECYDPLVPVMFHDTSATVSILDTLNYAWDFADAVGTAFIPDTNYFYQNPGDYNVELIVSTNYNCIDTVYKIVSVKPYITSYPYFTDFQTGPESWTGKTIADFDIKNSWDHNTWVLDPVPSNLSWSTSNTNDSSDYFNFERSYVSSPCFDFTSLKKPMIRFDMWRDFSDLGDGVVLESSIDNGQTWQVIGGEQTTDAGINWYNQIVINNGNGPGGDLTGGQPLGWSDVKDQNWVQVRHELDHLIGNSKVIFRLAFGTNGAGKDKGFAFDNIWVGERSKYVLVEHFTNTSCTPCVVTTNMLNPFNNKYRKDLINIQYHTNAILGDKLYADYQAGPSTRELFYGASQLPQTITDGNILNKTTTSWVSDSLITRRRTLSSAAFDIDLVKTINGSTYTVDATVTSGNYFSNNIDVYIAVIEKQILSSGILSNGGSVLNGEVAFDNVVKDMLPDAGGTRISNVWNAGDSQTISEIWNSSATTFYDLGDDDIEMVVFIQDSKTKEIYQTATTDTSFIEITIGVDEADNESDIQKQFSFNLYPNPTSGDLFLMFNQSINQNADVHIFNELGSLVEKRKLSNGIGSSFSTETYSEGIYFMSIVYKGERSTKRFMVIK